MLRPWATAVVFAALVTRVLPAAADPPVVDEEEEPRFSVSAVVDARFAVADEEVSWLDGGVGRTRWSGIDRDGDVVGDIRASAFHLAQLSIVVTGRIASELSAVVHVNVDPETPRESAASRVGIVESFILWRPVLSPNSRLRLRAGVTIPPFSLEHPETAWSTRYTITPSAIGTWIGEELRSTGVETTFTFALPHFTELDVQAAAFSANDPTGALLAWRGWALHDRQGQIGDEVPLPAVLSLTDERFFGQQGIRTEPFREIDGRVGYHVQARLRSRKRGFLQLGYYDNLGDRFRLEVDPRVNYTWDTRFFIAGAQLDIGPVSLLGQYIDGDAGMGPTPPAQVDTPFRAGYLLASCLYKKIRLSARYDRFAVDDKDVWREGKDLNSENGWASTVALIHELGKRQRLYAEYVHLEVERPFAETAGAATKLRQDQFQTGYRVRF